MINQAFLQQNSIHDSTSTNSWTKPDSFWSHLTNFYLKWCWNMWISCGQGSCASMSRALPIGFLGFHFGLVSPRFHKAQPSGASREPVPSRGQGELRCFLLCGAPCHLWHFDSRSIGSLRERSPNPEKDPREGGTWGKYLNLRKSTLSISISGLLKFRPCLLYRQVSRVKVLK